MRGGKIHGLGPDWRPLLDFVPDEVPEFMWMFRVDLIDGTVVEAYKHSWTRRYLHLDRCGRAYVFLGGGRYEEADPASLLDEVLEGRKSRGSIVRQNAWVSERRIGWARSATRHGVPRRQSLWVVQHAGICMELAIGKQADPLLFFFGEDQDERPLEVAAAEGPGGRLTVIHAMQSRERFEDRYMEASRWRR